MVVLRSTNLDFANGGAGYIAKATRSDLYLGWPERAHAPILPRTSSRCTFQRSSGATSSRGSLTLSSPERERAALAIARRVERDSLFAVYMNDALPELVSRRLGCIVHQPEYAGVDLAALCLKDSAD